MGRRRSRRNSTAQFTSHFTSGKVLRPKKMSLGLETIPQGKMIDLNLPSPNEADDEVMEELGQIAARWNLADRGFERVYKRIERLKAEGLPAADRETSEQSYQTLLK